MKNIRALKYYTPLVVYVLAMVSFASHGIYCWLGLVYAWVMIPFAELLMRSDESNLNAAEEELARKDKWYDAVLWIVVLAQYAAIPIFLFSMKDAALSGFDIAGRVFTMGLLCGAFGINVGHELGHRIKPFEVVLAKASLLTSLYMHFIVEHNKGHHKNVATREDPSSARLWEPVYFFWPRTIIYSYISAWHIANDETKKKSKPVFSLHNEMLQMLLIQILFVAVIFISFGWPITLYYLAAAAIGMLLLETVNYIEHYGLQRQQLDNGRYERAMPVHSWNSNHIIGRLMLFELSRHSDHHYLASRKYQILRHHDDAPQMPTGYPGMMILALMPPLWFYVMHKQMRKYNLLPRKENVFELQTT
ncbi:MAG TPA: alkane 1-monooxygenase [Chitinophagaceae bacterium]|nr:alkane 1-monooxygenase [Chitinophagaceae bacterium]